MVESRGRTGRKPTGAEKQGGTRAQSKSTAGRPNRFDRPPTWKGAFVRAMAAALLMLLISLVLLKGKSNQAIAIFPIVLLVYIPISYYTDLWLYKRRIAGKARRSETGAGGKQAARGDAEQAGGSGAK
ncbi:MAG: hypothetical protein ACTHM1_09455 [Solirubrobacteraceae bacterium]